MSLVTRSTVPTALSLLLRGDGSPNDPAEWDDSSDFVRLTSDMDMERERPWLPRGSSGGAGTDADRVALLRWRRSSTLDLSSSRASTVPDNDACRRPRCSSPAPPSPSARPPASLALTDRACRNDIRLPPLPDDDDDMVVRRSGRRRGRRAAAFAPRCARCAKQLLPTDQHSSPRTFYGHFFPPLSAYVTGAARFCHCALHAPHCPLPSVVVGRAPHGDPGRWHMPVLVRRCLQPG